MHNMAKRKYMCLLCKSYHDPEKLTFKHGQEMVLIWSDSDMPEFR